MPFAGEQDADPCPCLTLTYQQRMVGFLVCFALGTLCTLLAWPWIWVVAVAPGKFATPYTLGNLFWIGSTGFLMASVQHGSPNCALGRLF